MKTELIKLALSNGHSLEALKKWRQRGHVPAKHREHLLRSASRRLLKITAEDFAFPPTAGTGPKRKVH